MLAKNVSRRRIKKGRFERSRSWVFTLNNYDEKEEEALRALDCRYLIFGKERSESETPHLQGFVEFASQKRFSTLKRLFPFKRAHLEIREGTRRQARDYCTKDSSSEVFEKGTFEKGGQGSRSDLARICELLKNKSSFVEIVDEVPSALRYSRGISNYINQSIQSPPLRNLKVLYFYGAPGTGKTRLAMQTLDYFKFDDVDSLWFDGYHGQNTLILDDFYSSIKYSFLLKMLDIYPLRLPVKGSFTYACWERVIITSNIPLEEQYKKIPDTSALTRRVSKTVFFPNDIKDLNDLFHEIPNRVFK